MAVDRSSITSAVKLALSEIGVIPNGKEIKIIVDRVMDAIEDKPSILESVAADKVTISPAMLETLKNIK